MNKGMNALFRKAAALCQTLLRPAHLPIMPIHMQFEPSSRCNLKCIHCEHDKNRQYPKDATVNFFTQLFDSFRPLYLTMNGYGEPLLCEDLSQMISYAKQHGSLVNTTTNGILLKKYADRLLEADIDMVNVSLDAANDETYQKIRGAKKFATVIENVQHFSQRRKQIHPATQLRLSAVVQPANLKELGDFVQLGLQLGADIVLFQLVETVFFDYRGDEVVAGMSKQELKSNLNLARQEVEKCGLRSNVEWLLRHLDVQWEHHIKRNCDSGRQCWKPWHSVYVTVDGLVRPCCNFVKDDMNLANLADVGFSDAVNSAKFIHFRGNLSQKKRPLSPCRCCLPESLYDLLAREKF